MKPHIYNVRGARVMLDSDLATVFGVETKVLNQKVKRNMPLFSEGSVFQLTKEECQSERISCSRSQNVTLNGGRGSNIKYTPFAFTKEGVTVLKTLMKSQVEIDFPEEPSLPAVTENCWNEGTVVLYQPDNRPVNLEVKVTDENVWLSRNQIAILFDRDIKTISKHINNSMLEELQNIPTVANFATVQIEGGRKVTRYIEYYNLDVVLSVGYRVKSNNGIAFRRWANKVLKENVLYHNSITKRFERLESRVTKTEEKIDFFVKTSLPPKQTIFKGGQIYDAYALISSLIESANHRVILIDNYINTQVLTLLDKRKKGVKATIYTYPNHIKDPKFKLDIEKHNKQYAPINVLPAYKIHDRFLIIDEDIYASGASIKDAGVNTFAILKIDPVISTVEELLAKISK